MIDKVILYDIKCGKKYISTLQARQILGRAGRTYNKFEQGQTYIFGKEEQSDKINQYYYGDDNIVKSNLVDIDKIAFHILPDISNNKVKSIDDIKYWYEHTLAFIQCNKIDYNNLYSYLISNKCINEKFQMMPIGNLSIKYYYSPNRINVLSEKMIYLNNNNDFSDMALSWMFSYFSGHKVFHPLYIQFQEMISAKYYLHNNQMFDFFVYYLIFNHKRIKKIDAYIGKTKNDFLRLLALTSKISKINQINIDKQLKLIETMLYYNTDKTGAILMDEINIYDNDVIRKLLQIQVHNYKQLEYNIDFINNFYGGKIADVCNKVLQERKIKDDN